MFRLFLSVFVLSLPMSTVLADVIAARTIRVGVVLKAQDLDASAVKDDAEISAVLGKETQRTIYAGAVIGEGDVGPPTIIRRNDVVDVRYRSGGLGLRTVAKSLSEGGVGDRIYVMNIDTKVRIRATIVAPALVEVTR